MEIFREGAPDSNAVTPVVLLAASRDAGVAVTGLLFRAALKCSAAGGRVLFITKRLARYPRLPTSVVHARNDDDGAAAASSAAAGAVVEASDDELERIDMKYVNTHAELIYLLSHAHELTAPYRMVVLNGISSFFTAPLESATTRAALLRAVALAMSAARHFGARVGSSERSGGACRFIASDIAPSLSAVAGAAAAGETGTPNPNASMLERMFAVVLVAHEEGRRRGGRCGGNSGGGRRLASSSVGRSLVLRVRQRGRLAGSERGTLACHFDAAAAT